MIRKRISSGSTFEDAGAYSRVVVDGDFVFVAGTTGYDYSNMTISPDPAVQTEQTFRNIAEALAKAGASLADVVRVLYIVPNRADWPACQAVVRTHFDAVRPAATMISSALLTDEMKIEIEVTARLSKPQ
jgi:enamine deaminase RidA (YjgF/YER057c/UK114 family)